MRVALFYAWGAAFAFTLAALDSGTVALADTISQKSCTGPMFCHNLDERCNCGEGDKCQAGSGMLSWCGVVSTSDCEFDSKNFSNCMGYCKSNTMMCTCAFGKCPP